MSHQKRSTLGLSPVVWMIVQSTFLLWEKWYRAYGSKQIATQVTFYSWYGHVCLLWYEAGANQEQTAPSGVVPKVCTKRLSWLYQFTSCCISSLLFPFWIKQTINYYLVYTVQLSLWGQPSRKRLCGIWGTKQPPPQVKISPAALCTTTSSWIHDTCRDSTQSSLDANSVGMSISFTQFLWN